MTAEVNPPSPEEEELLDALYDALGVTASLAQHTEAKRLLTAHAARVREACAKVCEERAIEYGKRGDDAAAHEHDSEWLAARCAQDTANECAAALRSGAAHDTKGGGR